MARFNNIYPIDLKKGPAIVPISAMYYGNAKANRIGAEVTENGAAVALSGTCSGTVIRSDGGTVSVSGNVSGNTCYIDLPETAYAVAGPVSIFVTLTSGNVVTTLVGAFGTVTSTETGTIAPGTIPDTVDQLIAEIEAAVASIPADYSSLWSTFAANYSSSASYAVGDIVTYDGKLYKCTAPTTGNFDSTKWTQTTATAATMIGGGYISSADNLSDANQAIANRIYTITATSGVSNLPEAGLIGTLLPFSYQAAKNANGTGQIFITSAGNVYSRIRWNGSWKAWAKLDNGTLDADVSNLNTIVPNIKGSVGAPYYTSNTYHFGDYVEKDGTLYRCTAASTTGTWDADAWTTARLATSSILAGGAPGSMEILSDANNAVSNRVYTINYGTSASYVANLPYNNARGTLLTLAYLNTGTTGKTQLFVSSTGKVYARIYWSSAWQDWQRLTGAVMSNEARNGVYDFDDMASNRVYTLTADIDNAPNSSETGSYGTTLTINGDASYPNGEAEIHIGKYGDVYSRIYWDNRWTTWAKLARSNEIIALDDFYSGVGMFPRFGVVGDSFASGVIYTSGTSVDTHHYSLSWPQILARQSGGVAVNYSYGGLSTKTFITNSTYGLSKLLSDISNGNGCGLYLLCLGINDSNSSNTWGGISILGSSEDINTSNPDLNADTFWGNYSRIISKIKAAAPASRIVMTTFQRIPTPQTSEGFVPFNNAIKQIAAYNEIPCITLTDDPFFTSSFYLNKMVSSHPTAPQYVGYAKAMDRLIAKCAISNYDYFKTWTNGAADA
jgi:hypothetical protein